MSRMLKLATKTPLSGPFLHSYRCPQGSLRLAAEPLRSPKESFPSQGHMPPPPPGSPHPVDAGAQRLSLLAGPSPLRRSPCDAPRPHGNCGTARLPSSLPRFSPSSPATFPTQTSILVSVSQGNYPRTGGSHSICPDAHLYT